MTSWWEQPVERYAVALAFLVGLAVGGLISMLVDGTAGITIRPAGVACMEQASTASGEAACAVMFPNDAKADR